jgi:hypothetical protein
MTAVLPLNNTPHGVHNPYALLSCPKRMKAGELKRGPLWCSSQGCLPSPQTLASRKQVACTGYHSEITIVNVSDLSVCFARGWGGLEKVSHLSMFLDHFSFGEDSCRKSYVHSVFWIPEYEVFAV